MKEPVAVNGIVAWNGIRLSEAIVNELKSYGYKWNPKEQCYLLPWDVLTKKTTPAKLPELSFEPDAFHRALHPAYGGDCK